MWSHITIKGKILHILSQGNSGPIFIWLFYPHRGNELEHMEEVLAEQLNNKSCTIIACEVEDWKRDLSPWKATNMDGSEFEGMGPATLAWIKESLMPWVAETFSESTPVYVMGYSLAGLFAMWSLYECDLFDGAVCCSSSFWIEGWQQFVKEHPLSKESRVYLSLGGKEEKTKNPLMATVGDRTREMEKLLKADTNVSKVVLEWNSGGHFADSVKRLVKGIEWIER